MLPLNTRRHGKIEVGGLVILLAIGTGLFLAFHNSGVSLSAVMTRMNPPQPRIVGDHLNFSVTSDHHYVISVHNDGGDGLVNMSVKETPDKNSPQILRQWKTSAFIHHGEDHDFDIALTGASIFDGPDAHFQAECSVAEN